MSRAQELSNRLFPREGLPHSHLDSQLMKSKLMRYWYTKEDNVEEGLQPGGSQGVIQDLSNLAFK